MIVLRFLFGGMVACLFALAALILMAPVHQGEAPTTGSTAIRSEPEGTSARRHYLPNGISVATRLDWPLIAGENLHQFDRFGLAARAGTDSRILLATANAKTPDQMSGVLILIDTGDTATGALTKMQGFMERIRPKLSQATVIHDAQPSQIAGFNGAWGGFRAMQEGRIGARTLQARFELLHAGNRSLLAIQVSTIGSRAGNQLKDMLATLRVDD